MSDRLEEQLRQALRAEDPPAGFAQRVLERAAQQAQAASTPLAPTRSFWWQRLRLTASPWGAIGLGGGRAWAAAVAAIVLLAAGIGWYQRQAAQEEAKRQAELRARNQALYALQLTSEKIGPARRALAELGIDLAEGTQRAPEAVRR